MAFKEELKIYEHNDLEYKYWDKNNLLKNEKENVPQQVLLVLQLFRKGNLGNGLWSFLAGPKHQTNRKDPYEWG